MEKHIKVVVDLKRSVLRSVLICNILWLLIAEPGCAFTQKNNYSNLNRVPSITQIDSIQTLTALKKELDFLDQNSLVIFDVDKVLQMKADPWDRGFDEDRRKSETINSLYVENSTLNKKLDRSTRDRLWSIYVKSSKVAPVEPDTSILVHELQSKAKVICLTRFFTGKIGAISSVDTFRIQELKSLGYDFKQAFPKNNHIVFEQFTYENRFHPVFSDGVLFTALAVSKGELLQAFLNKIHWKPIKVIMIDDKKENLISVAQHLTNMGVPFVGYEYTGYSDVSKHFDKKLAEFQMQYLIKHEKWLDSTAAKKLMDQAHLTSH